MQIALIQTEELIFHLSEKVLVPQYVMSNNIQNLTNKLKSLKPIIHDRDRSDI